MSSRSQWSCPRKPVAEANHQFPRNRLCMFVLHFIAFHFKINGIADILQIRRLSICNSLSEDLYGKSRWLHRFFRGDDLLHSSRFCNLAGGNRAKWRLKNCQRWKILFDCQIGGLDGILVWRTLCLIFIGDIHVWKFMSIWLIGIVSLRLNRCFRMQWCENRFSELADGAF